MTNSWLIRDNSCLITDFDCKITKKYASDTYANYGLIYPFYGF